MIGESVRSLHQSKTRHSPGPGGAGRSSTGGQLRENLSFPRCRAGGRGRPSTGDTHNAPQEGPAMGGREGTAARRGVARRRREACGGPGTRESGRRWKGDGGAYLPTDGRPAAGDTGIPADGS